MNNLMKHLFAGAFAAVVVSLFAANGGYENSIDMTVDAEHGYGDYATTVAKPTAAEALTMKFAQCKNLSELDLSDVTAIGDAAFAYSAFGKVTIPANVTSIGFIAFGGCSNLTAVTLESWNWATGTPDVEAKEPFRDCDNLTTLTVPGGVPSVSVPDLFPAVTKILCPAANIAAWQAACPGVTVELDPEILYTLTFVSNGGTSVAAVRAKAGAALVAPVAPTRSGFTFEGWFSDAALTVAYSFGAMPAKDFRIYAKWAEIPPPPVMVTATFDFNDGVTASAKVSVEKGAAPSAPGVPARAGWTFAGWVPAISAITADTTYTAKWTENVGPGGGDDPGTDDPGTDDPGSGDPVMVTATFDFNDGVTASAKVSVEKGAAPAVPGVPTRAGWTFAGWVPDVTAIAADTTFTAKWVEAGSPEPEPEADAVLYENPAATPFLGNATYLGWVRDASGAVQGTLTVKAAKGAKAAKGGQSKLTVQYVPFGGKKQTIKLDKAAMPVTNQIATVAIPGVGSVKLGYDSFAGVGCDVQMGQDFTKSKVKAEKDAAKARLAAKVGAWTFALGSDAGCASFSVTVAKTGKGKLAGALPDGTKVSVSAQGVLGEKGLAIPFLYSKAGKGSLAFVFWVDDDGTARISDLTALQTASGATYAVESEGPYAVAKLADGAHVFVADGLVEQAFETAGRKWTFPKHVSKPTDEKPDLNPSSLKLTFTEKTGAVKGSFTVLDAAGKKVKYTVAGMVVGNAVLGTAYNRTAGSLPVAAE